MPTLDTNKTKLTNDVALHNIDGKITALGCVRLHGIEHRLRGGDQAEQLIVTPIGSRHVAVEEETRQRHQGLMQQL